MHGSVFMNGGHTPMCVLFPRMCPESEWGVAVESLICMLFPIVRVLFFGG